MASVIIAQISPEFLTMEKVAHNIVDQDQLFTEMEDVWTAQIIRELTQRLLVALICVVLHKNCSLTAPVKES